MGNNAERSAWRQLQLDWSGRQHLLRRWLTDDSNVKHLLRILFDHTPSGETDCWLLVETVAREMSCSPRKAQRAIREAEKDDLIIVFGPRGKRRCNTFRLRMANIFDRARAELKGDKLAPQGCQPDTPEVTTWHPKGDNLAPRSSIEVGTEVPPPPKSGAREKRADHPSDEWGVVEEELLAYGVQDPEPAAEKARQRGCSAPFVRRVIDYARTKAAADGTRAWGGGALRRRILNLTPGQEIDDESLWLPPSSDYTAARRREAEQRQREQERRDRQRRRDEVAQRPAHPLEAHYGAQLDSLAPNDLLQLARTAFPGPSNTTARKSLRRIIGRGDRIVAEWFRRPLLEALAAREEAPR